ncbi:hypothetical protein SAMN04489761_4281 [Tenacibaculum sp. MAR_2009_124]|uniref:hypothetical protein n=1 Tax=Tenacibaculum sp. MAR_2009_124 TaxID=1250059 RepID=UPI000899AB90|nr:hypothetical protein [Tenacibaculum sp. MAR_2009_124]SED10264.1 hypothetical protein SAMN04489761_4281 [Tenacibaculum sp. MAR_2009_124]
MKNRDLELLKHNQKLKDSLDVSVKIDWRQVLKITVEDLIKKRNAPSNKIKESFDDVLKYYLGEEDFHKYVIEKKQIKL